MRKGEAGLPKLGVEKMENWNSRLRKTDYELRVPDLSILDMGFGIFNLK